MKLSANMAKEATCPQVMRSGTLQTRGAFVRDRNSWRESRLNVTNKYLEVQDLEKWDSGFPPRRFKFPHRTLKGKVRCSLTVPIRITDTQTIQVKKMPIVWCDTTGSCFYFVSRSGHVVEFCASNRSECLEWYVVFERNIGLWRSLPPVCSRISELTLSRLRHRPTRHSQHNLENIRTPIPTLEHRYSIIRETMEMCVASPSVKSLLKMGNSSSKRRRPDLRRSSDEDDNSSSDGANLITVTCLQNSLLRIPQCAVIEQAWYVCVCVCVCVSPL